MDGCWVVEIEGSVVDRSGERGEKEEVLDMIR
jgi:hypothetical protein